MLLVGASDSPTSFFKRVLSQGILTTPENLKKANKPPAHILPYYHNFL
jgi:hypothetical protein